ncbi:hypothetical protein [Haladaptatus caseinilyticus]|uniref:hypothetical protein n=1 Tax=Haladaptatus caseinilyticus TaxID=2993314 RepID=UPI00224A501A|nr:hypothetical protein [Haladaptatus caseinilyticus]
MLSESTDATDDTPETPMAILDRARQHTADVATEHFPELPIEVIEWTVSPRTMNGRKDDLPPQIR